MQHGKHVRPIDSRMPDTAAVLDLSALNVGELGALVDMCRHWQLLASQAGVDMHMWREFADLRMEVRHVFIQEFFKVD